MRPPFSQALRDAGIERAEAGEYDAEAPLAASDEIRFRMWRRGLQLHLEREGNAEELAAFNALADRQQKDLFPASSIYNFGRFVRSFFRSGRIHAYVSVH